MKYISWEIMLRTIIVVVTFYRLYMCLIVLLKIGLRLILIKLVFLRVLNVSVDLIFSNRCFLPVWPPIRLGQCCRQYKCGFHWDFRQFLRGLQSVQLSPDKAHLLGTNCYHEVISVVSFVPLQSSYCWLQLKVLLIQRILNDHAKKKIESRSLWLLLSVNNGLN